jgi:ABC-type uncharacterized transport system fused permease/ATPase subunit
MAELEIPDLCAHLDRLKRLCDQLEEAQTDPKHYHQLIADIRYETEAFQAMVCHVSESEQPTLGLATT